MSLTLNADQKQSLLWLAIGVAILLLLHALAPVLMPFIVAGIFAYALNPFVDKLSSFKIKKWAIPRALAATLVMVSLVATVLLLLLIIVPVLQREIPQLQDQIPRFLDKLNLTVAPWLQQFGIKVKLDSAGVKAMLTKQLASGGDIIGKSLISSVRVGGMALLGLIANLLLIPIVLFYLLIDWHAFLMRVERFIPRRWLHYSLQGAQEVDSILAQYLRGQIIVMLVLAVYYSIALTIAGFDVALPVGIITGLLVFIPYLGFGLGLVLALISAFLQFNDFSGLISVAVIYGFGQVLESFYLTPRLVGERIGLHPVTVIFALLAFGQLFGFIGILVALPASAIIAVAARHLRRSYFNSTFYHRA